MKEGGGVVEVVVVVVVVVVLESERRTRRVMIGLSRRWPFKTAWCRSERVGPFSHEYRTDWML
jgi:hypothetical protein